MVSIPPTACLFRELNQVTAFDSGAVTGIYPAFHARKSWTMKGDQDEQRFDRVKYSEVLSKNLASILSNSKKRITKHEAKKLEGTYIHTL